MKSLKLALLGISAFAVFAVSGCDKCKDTAIITLAEGEQGFSITYLDSSGLDLVKNGNYNASNVKVFVSTEGPFGQYRILNEEYADGIVGPFDFANSPDPVAKGVPYDYVYIIDKSAAGAVIDTVRLKFVIGVDECREYWQQIEYFKNPNVNAGASNVPEAQSGSENATFTFID